MLDSVRIFGDTTGSTIRARYKCVDIMEGSVWLSPGAGCPSLGLTVALEIDFDPHFASVFRLDSVYLFWHEQKEPFVLPGGLLWASKRGDTVYFYNPSGNTRVDVYNILGQRVAGLETGAPGKSSLPLKGPDGIYIVRMLIEGRETKRLIWRKMR